MFEDNVMMIANSIKIYSLKKRKKEKNVRKTRTRTIDKNKKTENENEKCEKNRELLKILL